MNEQDKVKIKEIKQWLEIPATVGRVDIDGKGVSAEKEQKLDIQAGVRTFDEWRKVRQLTAKPIGPGYTSFTDRARKVMQLANQEAQRLNHEQVEPEHVLVGILKEGNGIGAQILANLADKINLVTVRNAIEKDMPAKPDKVTMNKLPHSERTKCLVAMTIEAAKRLGHSYVGTEHLLCGLFCVDGSCYWLLKDTGLTAEGVEEEIKQIVAPSGGEKGIPAKEAFAKLRLDTQPDVETVTRVEKEQVLASDIHVAGFTVEEEQQIRSAIEKMQNEPGKVKILKPGLEYKPCYSFREQNGDYSYEVTFVTHAELIEFLRLAMPKVFEKKE